MSNFSGEKMRSWRLASGLTQKDLAACLGVSQQAISCWEKGYDRPSFSVATKILELISADELLTIEREYLESDPSLRCLIDLTTHTIQAASLGMKNHLQCFEEITAQMSAVYSSKPLEKLLRGYITIKKEDPQMERSKVVELVWFSRKKKVGHREFLEAYFVQMQS